MSFTSGNKNTKKVIALICVMLILLCGIGSTVAYVVTGTPLLTNLFLNGLSPDGDLIIEKTIVHPFGDDFIIPDNIRFDFEVSLGEKYAGKSVSTSQGEKTADDNGAIVLSIGHAERAAVYDIDENTEVKVTEITDKKGFTADKKSRQLVIEKYTQNIVSFVNTYSPQKADASAISLEGKKELIGRDWIEGDSFTFELSVNNADEWQSLAKKTVTYELNEAGELVNDKFSEFSFTDELAGYPFDKAGTYSFKVEEVEGVIGGITYDSNISYFDICVTDADMDGRLEISDITTPSENTVIDGSSVNISFKNSYAPFGTAKATIFIDKDIKDTSNSGVTAEGYEFELYNNNGELVCASEPTAASGETVIELTYLPKTAGTTFNYVLKEKNCAQQIGPVKYDDKEYKLQVCVQDNLDGTVSAFISDIDDDAPQATNEFFAEFENVYDPTDAFLELSGTKQLEGREIKEGEFEFALYNANEMFEVMQDTPERTAKNEGNSFSFDRIEFDEVGTYYFIAIEDASAGISGIIYDESRYLITVNVKDNEGVLEAEYTVQDEYGSESQIVFNNTYKAMPCELVLKGTKQLNNADIADYSFTFELYTADEQFNAADTAFMKANNDENGEFCFDKLIFEKAGTYRYIVTESAEEALDGITYDDRAYCISVHVVDPGKGKLEVETVDITADGVKLDKIEFVNTYTKPDDPVVPDDPTQPDTPDEPTPPDAPTDDNTGDTSRIGLWIVLMIACFALAIAIIVFLLIRRAKAKLER